MSPVAVPAAPTPTAAFWAAQEALDRAADEIIGVLGTAVNYTSVSVDAAAMRITVFGTRPFASADWSQARALLPPDSSLAFETALLAAPQVRMLDSYVVSHVAELRARAWGLSDGHGPYQLFVAPGTVLSERHLAQLTQFGPDTLEVVQSDGSATGRFNDSNPFFGGARINGPSGAGGDPNKYAICTHGFGTRSNTNGSYYMLTAAHCIKWSDSRVWTNQQNAPKDNAGVTLVGSATANDLAWDAAYVKVASPNSAGSSIYTGDPPSDWTSSTVVAGSATNHAGDWVRASGSVMLRTGLIYIAGTLGWQSTNGYNGSSYATTGWKGVTDAGSTAITAGGDSGGPVFSYNASNQVLARGIESYGIASISCPSWVPTIIQVPECYTIMGFTDVNSMLSARSLSITP